MSYRRLPIACRPKPRGSDGTLSRGGGDRRLRITSSASSIAALLGFPCLKFFGVMPLDAATALAMIFPAGRCNINGALVRRR